MTFEGQFYKTEKATIYDRPSTPVPIYLAASGPTVAKMAGEIAEGYICTSGKAPELYTRDVAAEGGRRACKPPAARRTPSTA